MKKNVTTLDDFIKTHLIESDDPDVAEVGNRLQDFVNLVHGKKFVNQDMVFMAGCLMMLASEMMLSALPRDHALEMMTSFVSRVTSEAVVQEVGHG